MAAGYYDGFFETGLSPWDVAAGSLMITEAGGLVGNFTGEADFLYQREVVAGNPKVYGQLVQLLGPYSQLAVPPAEAPRASGPRRESTADLQTPEAALGAAVAADSTPEAVAEPEAPVRRPPTRIRKAVAGRGESS